MQHLRRAATALVLVVAVVAAAAFVKAFVGESYYIPSPSMLPGLHLHDRIIVSRLSYDLHDQRRGDVVVFAAPPGVLPPDRSTALRRLAVDVGLVDPTAVLVKRVIGLPGDTVQGRGGRIYIDGRLLLEPYLAPGTLTSEFGPVHVPAGHIFVMGDNRSHSADSTVHMCRDGQSDCVPGAEFVPVDLVVGKVFVLLWPRSHFHWLHRPSTFSDIPDAP